MSPWNLVHEILVAGAENAAYTAQNLFLSSEPPGPPSFSFHNRVVLVLFNSALLCFSPPFVFLSVLFLLPDLTWSQLLLPILYGSRLGWGAWQWVLFKGQQWDGGSIFISPDKRAWRQSTGGLWSCRSVHSALKSADTVYSSHPENDLIYSWWAATAAVDYSWRL